MDYKIPISILVVIHTPALDVLLLERADKQGYWQSVTGSLDHLNEPLAWAAQREVKEETSIDITTLNAYALRDWQHTTEYEIYPHWRHRYAQHVSRNTEHWFSLEVPKLIPIKLAPREHLQYRWMPWYDAATLCFSPSNRAAILSLPQRLAHLSSTPL